VEKDLHPVYHSLNKQLTILGVERKLFFLLLVVSIAIFELSGALVPAFVFFIPLFFGLRIITRVDPKLLRIVLTSERFAARYDPAKSDSNGEEEEGHDGPSRAV
jgi:type IV secretory pathway VirB3-like protein